MGAATLNPFLNLDRCACSYIVFFECEPRLLSNKFEVVISFTVKKNEEICVSVGYQLSDYYSYFCAVLFPVDLITKRAILEVARRASSRLF